MLDSRSLEAEAHAVGFLGDAVLRRHESLSSGLAEIVVLRAPHDPDRAIATSPAVGVFRPGVAIGTAVHAGDRIAIVDLLGIAQDVTSPIDGTLVELFVQAGEAVEYGEEIGAIEADAPVPPAAGDAPAAPAGEG